jgi:hypothetical protein
MFFSKIKELFNETHIDVSEHLSTVETSFTICRSQLSDVKNLIAVCSEIPSRDKLEFNLVYNSEYIFTLNNTGINEDLLFGFIDDIYPDDEIRISIHIKKTPSGNRFSIYDYHSFADDLTKRPILEVMGWFSDLLKDKSELFFEVFDYDISLSTRTIAFESYGNSVFSPAIDRNERISLCRDMSAFYNMDKYELIPDDFIITGIKRAGEELVPLFDKISTILSLLYVVSSSTVDDEGICLQINGQRTLKNSLAFEDIVKNKKWISTYDWIYDKGNTTDKMLIANNVMSLYCKYDSFINTDEVMFEAIKTNYRLYLRNNVTQYLDLKRDISKFIQETVSQVGDYSLSILSKFKNNLIAMAGFLFTAVLTQIGSQNGFKDAFTKEALWLFELFLVGSIIYLIICLIESIYQIKNVKIGYEEIKNNYNDILSPFEIREAFQNDTLFNKTKKKAYRGIIMWSIVWGSCLIAAILFIELLTEDKGLVFWLYNKIK